MTTDQPPGSPLERAIFHAVRAGAFRCGARDFRDAAETMLAAARVNHERAARALDEMLRGLNLDCRDSGVEGA